MCPTNLGCSIPQLNRTMRISCMQMVSLRPQPSCYFSPIPAHLLVAEKGSAEFEEFLNFLGEKIALQGWAEYNGGLDVKSTYSHFFVFFKVVLIFLVGLSSESSTGTHSFYAKYSECEIMFHVATYLPYFPLDTQQVERKRHLGNDVVIIIFREADNEPFSPLWFHSQFNRTTSSLSLSLSLHLLHPYPPQRSL